MPGKLDDNSLACQTERMSPPQVITRLYLGERLEGLALEQIRNIVDRILDKHDYAAFSEVRILVEACPDDTGYVDILAAAREPGYCPHRMFEIEHFPRDGATEAEWDQLLERFKAEPLESAPLDAWEEGLPLSFVRDPIN